MMKKKKSAGHQWMKDICHTITMYKKGFLVSFRSSKKYYLVVFLNRFRSIIQIYIGLWLSALLLDELAGEKDLNQLIGYAAAVVLSEFVLSVFGRYLDTREDTESYFFSTAEQQLFVDKIMQLDYSDIEDSEIQGLYRKVREASNAGNNHNLMCLRADIPVFLMDIADIGIAVWMLSGFVKQTAFPLWSWILIFAVYAGSTWISLKGGAAIEKIYQEYMKKIAGFCRARDALTDYLERYTSGKNLRIFEGDKLTIENLAGWHHQNDMAVNKRNSDTFRSWFLSSLIPASAAEALVWIFIAAAALLGQISVGNIARYVICMKRVSKSVFNLGEICVSMKYNADYLEEYFSFLELPGKMKMGTLPVEKRHDNEFVIEFAHVSFRYPNSDEYVLKDINLTFRVGEKMAIVGQNGSGKTTFIKLLCRLYDPTEGTIYLNGIDIRKFDYQEYLQLFSIVFQDFKLLSFSLGENIAADTEYDKKRVRECIEKAGMEEFLLQQQKGLDTVLYKEFDQDGIEVSGGEAQKIALARAIYKNAPYVLLDEPTAALDPIAEFEIYSRFQEIVGDRTTVFISHRLSSCRFCRDIAVFHEGQLVQRGSHDELIANKNGKYYELWNAQAQYYN